MSEKDLIDSLINEWGKERSDLDTSAMEIVGRILKLSKILEKRASKALTAYNIYYTDLDGSWVDTDENDIYDYHEGNKHPEIGIGRIVADNMNMLSASETELINNYFYKNHLFIINKNFRNFCLTISMNNPIHFGTVIQHFRLYLIFY